MPCLDGNALQALARGTLGAEELARAHEHLDACPLCRRLAAEVADDGSLSPEAAPTEPITAAGTAGSLPQANLATGSFQFGRYFVIAPLGQGGMGRVYLAYDPKLDRKVALKRLRAQGGPLRPEARARLLREAQAMARLSHPNVLAVHDAGEVGDEVFIAMEYVQGGTLRGWLKEPHSWREILTLFCAAGEGLAAAHRAGITHRDFKPDNVLVGEEGQVRVTDFGLARSRGSPELEPGARPPAESAADEAPRTEPGAVLGTPGYIAPEALRGEQGPLSDQFSFFVSLYEALLGERPFQGASLVAQLRAADRGQLRPSRRPRGVPNWLQRAVLVGLAPDPNRRFPSMAEALAALRRASQRSRRRRQLGAAILGFGALAAAALWLAGRPARLCAGAERYLAGTWDEAGKQRMRSAFLAAGAPGAEVTFQQTARALDAWAGAWVGMRTKACVAARVVGEQSPEVMELRMRCLDRRWMDFEALVRRFSTPGEVPVDEAVRAAASTPGLFECANPSSLAGQNAPPDGAARARHDELRRLLAEARVDQLVRAVQPGLRLAQQVERESRELELPALRAEALLLLARLRDDMGEYPGAERDLVEALAVAQANGHDALVGEASIGLMAIIGGRQLRFAEAHHWEKLASASLERSGLSGQEQEARLLNTVGGVALFEGADDLALESFKKALALRERLYGTEHILVAETLHNLATECAVARRGEEALQYAKRALALREHLLGSEHRDIALSLDTLGRLARDAGRVRESLALCERAVSLAQRTFPQEHPNQAVFLTNLGLARVDSGDLQGAEEAFERALAIQRKSLGKDHPKMGLVLDNLAWVAIFRGNYSKAIALGEEVARAFPAKRAEALGDVGEAHRRAGRLEEAQRKLVRALELLREKPEDRVEVQVLTRMAETELSRGLRAKARERLERALDLGERGRLPPQDLAQTRFALARALPSSEASRARELAREARAWFETTRRDAELRQVDGFLASIAAGARSGASDSRGGPRSP